MQFNIPKLMHLLAVGAILARPGGATDTIEQRQLAHLDNFRLVAHATLFGRESTGIDAEVRLAEEYSNTGRARLEFLAQHLGPHEFRSATAGPTTPTSQADREHQVSYHFDANSNRFLRTLSRATRGRCELSNSTALAQDLFGPKTTEDAPELAGWEQLLSGLRMPAHLVGLARLLVFVDLNRQGFRRVGQPGRAASMRNADVDQFEFTFETMVGQEEAKAQPGEVSLKMYLGGSADASAYPFRIWLKLPSRAELIVDFSSIGPIQPGAGGGLGESLPSEALNFPLGRGCSARLLAAEDETKKPKEARAVTRAKQSQAVFSFEAELSELWFLERPKPLGRLAVAFDGHARVLRVDTWRPGEQVGSATIHDLGLARKFHLVHDDDHHSSLGAGAPSDAREDAGEANVLEVVDEHNGPAECLATSMSRAQIERLEAAQILPWASLVEMGLSLVRGREARVFETTSEHLPEFIFQQVAYLEPTGEERSVFNFRRKGMAGEPYSIVYFVAQERFEGGGGGGNGENKGSARDIDQLIRLDVYQREVLLYRVEVHHFQWHLSEWAQGQQPEELFSIGDRQCGGGGGGGHQLARVPARMELGLTYVENVEMLHVLPEDVLELLESSHALNSALVRALAGQKSNSIFASQVGEVRARLHLERDERGEADLARLRVWADLELGPIAAGGAAFRLTWVGTCLSSGSKKPSPRSMTFDQCLWEAASEWSNRREVDENANAVLFSFCQSFCWIDSQVGVTKSSQVPGRIDFHSHVFMVSTDSSRQLPCELLRIQREATIGRQRQQVVGEGAGEEIELRPWRDVQQNLKGKILQFPFVNELAASHLGHVELLFNVNKVAISGPEVVDSSGLSVEGLAHSPAEALPVELVDAEHALETCHAHCVADLECRSFSICHRPEFAECFVSKLDLAPTNSPETTMNRIQAELERVRKLDASSPERKSGVLSINLPGEEGNPPIEFQVNRRCQLRTKRPLEMFAEPRPGAQTKLRPGHLLPVANLSQCAHLCLAKNVKFFKRLVESRVELEERQHQAAGGVAGKPQELQASLQETMRFWCDSFKFLDLKANPLPYKTMGQLLAMMRANNTVGHSTIPNEGLCYLARPRWAPSDQARSGLSTDKPASQRVARETQNLISLAMDAYDFRYENLYARSVGFRMSSSKKSTSSSLPAASQSRIHINNQTIETHPPSVEFCARQCFSQAIHWCRSFDVITFEGSGQQSCVYNSLGLRDVPAGVRDQLCDHLPAWSALRYDHFEPREVYALDNVALSYLNEQVVGPRDEKLAGGDSWSASEAVWCTLLGLCTGLALSALLVTKFNLRGDRNSRTHTGSHLDQPRLSREFICMAED